MFIKSLELKNFRNIDKAEIRFSSGINVLYGDNAQGKTNITEAIRLFSSCKSFRTNNERELIKNGYQNAHIIGIFERNGREYRVEFLFDRDKRREITLNGIKVRPKEILGRFTSVLFYPEQLSLVKNGPDERRKFLDFSICQIKPGFCDALQNYSRILIQRNRLLKNGINSSEQTLDIWDEKLSSLSCVLSQTRQTYLQKLETYAKKLHYEISSGSEELALNYVTGNTDFSAEQVLQQLKKNRERDFLLGYTSQGAHKDDFSVMINGQNARIFGSQGQQRSCVISIKLAEAEILNKIYGEYPLVLLDDVLSELDESRREYIIDKINGKQVVITTCERNEFPSEANAVLIKDGKAECTYI